MEAEKTARIQVQHAPSQVCRQTWGIQTNLGQQGVNPLFNQPMPDQHDAKAGRRMATLITVWIAECASRIPLLGFLNNDFNKFKALLINLFISLLIS